jgi:hypothetical protein
MYIGSISDKLFQFLDIVSRTDLCQTNRGKEEIIEYSFRVGGMEAFHGLIPHSPG